MHKLTLPTLEHRNVLMRERIEKKENKKEREVDDLV